LARRAGCAGCSRGDLARRAGCQRQTPQATGRGVTSNCQTAPAAGGAGTLGRIERGGDAEQSRGWHDQEAAVPRQERLQTSREPARSKDRGDGIYRLAASLRRASQPSVQRGRQPTGPSRPSRCAVLRSLDRPLSSTTPKSQCIVYRFLLRETNAASVPVQQARRCYPARLLRLPVRSARCA